MFSETFYCQGNEKINDEEMKEDDQNLPGS